MHRLNPAKIHALPAGMYHDGGGLYLNKATATSGSWVYRWGAKKMGLGSTALIGLAQAREKAQACRDLRADGLDPARSATPDGDLFLDAIAGEGSPRVHQPGPLRE
jgi:hypothetical protein